MVKTIQLSRRAFLKATGFALGAVALGSAGFALYEPHDVVVEHIELRLPRLPRALEGFRFAQLSDLHFGDFTYRDHLREAVTLVNAEQLDMVVLTGDFITAPLIGSRRKAAENAWPCADVLKDLRTRYGSFAVLGNHDLETNASTVVSALEAHDIKVLRNLAVPIETNQSRLWLAGVDDALKGRPDIGHALAQVPRGECVITAAHEPDYADVVAKYDVDLQISGHTHGGQVRFPVVGPMYLPRLGRKYVMGMYRVRQLQLYTNRGLGVVHLPMRFLSPPEITLFTLRSMS